MTTDVVINVENDVYIFKLEWIVTLKCSFIETMVFVPFIGDVNDV